MPTESYLVTLRYTREDETRERTMSTVVEIDAGDPFTDVSDIANDRLYERDDKADVVLDENIEDVAVSA